MPFRFVDTGKKSPNSETFKTALKSFMPQKVEGVELVHASHEADMAKITELATRKMAEVPGLDRQAATELIHNEFPELFSEIDQKAETQDRVAQIKSRIKSMQQSHPGWNFHTCWQKLQSQSPSLFEGLD